MAVLLVAMLSCGGRAQGLDGKIAVVFVWHGDWTATARFDEAAFVDELSASSYFDPLRERGIRPLFVVAASGIRIDMYAPGSDDGMPPCGWHGIKDGVLHIGVGSICSGRIEAAFSLSHELVETATDPELTGEEVADECDSRAYLVLPSGAAPVARYMTRDGCTPR